MPLRRRCYPLFFVGTLALCASAWSNNVHAQIVIRERIEVDPAHPDTTAGPATAPPPMANAWPGGVRGKGAFRFYLTGALLRAQPLSSLSATLTTTKGRVYSLPLSVGAQTGTRMVCHREGPMGSHPEWPECEEWTYGGGLLAEFHLEADENPGTLRLTGPGLDLTRTITIREPPYQGSNKITDWGLNCGYHYYLWGPYHFADCDCMVGRTGEVHGKISFRWEFTADPAERFVLTAPNPVINFKPVMPYGTGLMTVQAAYADGTPGPLADNTTLTYTASSTAYGSFYHDPCGYGCQKERGAVMTTRYRGMGSKRYQYLADGDHGDGSPPATTGPVCDTPISVTVAGGGLSGSADILIRGSSTSTTLDRLAVTASPATLGPDEQAALSAVAVTADGCEGGGLPANTPMTFSVEDDYYGELAYGMQQGTTIGGVPYSDAEVGAVLYDRNGREPYYDWPVEVEVSGGGSGTGSVTIRGEEQPPVCQTGNAMLDDERVQVGLKRLWAAATLDERGRRVSVDARREFCGYILPVFGGGFTLLAYDDPDDYSTQTQVSASCPTPSNLPPDAILVHTHPFYRGDRIPGGAYQTLQPSEPGDFDALREGNLQQGLVFDGHRMRFFYPGGSADAPIDRCGY